MNQTAKRAAIYVRVSSEEQIQGYNLSAQQRAVDRLYRAKPFESDSERVVVLLERYQALAE